VLEDMNLLQDYTHCVFGGCCYAELVHPVSCHEHAWTTLADSKGYHSCFMPLFDVSHLMLCGQRMGSNMQLWSRVYEKYGEIYVATKVAPFAVHVDSPFLH